MREPWRSTSGPYQEAVVKLSRYAPLEHPLAHQFQRAIESLTAALAPDSARQYRGAARHFLIYLGEDHPPFVRLDQLRRDPHILGWFAHLRSQNPPLAPAVYICSPAVSALPFWRSLPGLHSFPIWLI